MSLADSIHQLCRPHLTNVDGVLRHAPALLAELRLAVTPGRNSSGGGGAEGAPSPINLGALDLLGDIEKEARKDYAEATGKPWQGELEALLQSYPDTPISAEWEAYLARVLLGWVDRINTQLWPVKPRRKLVGVRCPGCGFATYGDERTTCLSLGCWDADGNMRKIGEWDVECAGCEAWWGPDRIEWLITALNASDTPTKENVAEVAEVA